MNPLKIITTSWDDGHPLDFRLAELLDKYNLPGTFYIPQKNGEIDVMPEKDIAVLSKSFEIGGHTLNHRSLRRCTNKEVEFEVNGCLHWLKDITGISPVSFCPPYGHYTNYSLAKVYEAGFKIIRTTGLLSTGLEAPLIGTTMQVYDHSQFTIFRHLVKKKKLKNLWQWSQVGCPPINLNLVDHYINQIEKTGGCFHLWGHSWEIEKYGLWSKLEAICKRLSNISGFQYMDNKGLLYQPSQAR